MVAELFPYKWPNYRGFTAAKIVHLIAEIAGIQKIDPYTSIELLVIEFVIQTFRTKKCDLIIFIENVGGGRGVKNIFYIVEGG